jgi:hypothetical protein
VTTILTPERVVAARLAETIESHYAVEVDSIARIARGMGSTNWLVRTPAADYFLKQYAPDADVAGETAALRLSQEARAAGVPAPRVIPSVTGDLLWAKGDLALALFEYFPDTTSGVALSCSEMGQAGHTLGRLHAWLRGRAGLRDSAAASLLRGRETVALRAAAALWRGRAGDRAGRALDEWAAAAPPLDAAALRALGVAPGPEIGRWLSRLRDAVIDGTLPPGPAGTAPARRMVAESLVRGRRGGRDAGRRLQSRRPDRGATPPRRPGREGRRM